ncbi:hypothetical protein E2C01_078225 [Portunus trituberculatus]|uniref:Uncharacterized protein n=1 Tax=Portunus trituberculatus TaxID=210409 RepID=A0A5B7IM30_PORTR|nr:hypothetical protein [Portunus trituberculatus]
MCSSPEAGRYWIARSLAL